MAELLALLAAMAAQQGDAAALRARVAVQPPAIRDFIARRANCNHWSGEYGYDAGRRAEIERALGELGCATIRGEDVFLRRHFAARADTLALLDETRDILGW